MCMKKMVTMAQELLRDYLKEDSICADFTMGNGLDTLFLATHACKGHIYAFDIQEQALANTAQRLSAHARAHVDLILENHAHLDRYIKEPLDVGIFNFGYLPSGDPSLTTEVKHSQVAVHKAFSLLKRHGLLVLVLYPGHPQGKLEADYFTSWCEQLEVHQATIMKICMIHKPQAPFVLAIEKLGDLYDRSSYF